jgi:hypothetical protein
MPWHYPDFYSVVEDRTWASDEVSCRPLINTFLQEGVRAPPKSAWETLSKVSLVPPLVCENKVKIADCEARFGCARESFSRPSEKPLKGFP